MAVKYDFDINLQNENNAHSKILSQIVPNSLVLECGCSKGYMTRYLKEVLNAKVFIVEIDQMAFAQAISYAEDGVCTDLNDCTWTQYFGNVRFDYILFADVLEHTYNPASILKATVQLLKDDGKVIFSLPNVAHNDILLKLYNDEWDYTKTGLLDDTHIHFFAEKNLTSLCDEAGLGIVLEDYTQCPVFMTEQHAKISNYPTSFIGNIKRRVYGEVYQYILTAQRKEFIEEKNIEKAICRPYPGGFMNTIYYAGENCGFSDEKSITGYLGPDEKFEKSYDLAGMGASVLRFDPVEGINCVVWNLKVSADGIACTINPINGVYLNEFIFFETDDPQVLVELPTDFDGTVTISAMILPLDQACILELMKAFKLVDIERKDSTEKIKMLEDHITNISIKAEMADRKAETLEESVILYKRQASEAEAVAAEQEKCISKSRAETAMFEQRAIEAEAVAAEKEQCIVLMKANTAELERLYYSYKASYNSISTSTIWRLSKPYRICGDFLKAQIRLRLETLKGALGKTWRYYRACGLKATFKKIRIRFRKKPAIMAMPVCRLESMQVLMPEEEVPDTGKTVSVVIPVKNAGAEYENLLRSLFSQKGFSSIELVMVDSGSTDDTMSLSKKFGAKIVEILPEEFSHSYARNLGVENASGEFVCIMTQDALPTSKRWLYNLWQALNSAPDVAAVSCTEFPRWDCDLYYRAFEWNHYNYLGAWNKDIYMAMPIDSSADSIRRNSQLSDITCFTRRETLMKYKYRGGFAEDLDLGMRLISDGYKLAFLGTEQVIHSHNRDADYYFRRRFVELKTLKEIFPDTEMLPCNFDDVANQTIFLLICLSDIFDNQTDEVRSLENFRSEFLEKYCRLRKGYLPPVNEKVKRYWSEHAQGCYRKALDCFWDTYSTNNVIGRQYNGQMLDATEGYFGVLFSYLNECYELVDKNVIADFRDCTWKIVAGVSGTFLAYSWFSATGGREIHAEIYHEAGSGV